MIKRNKKGQFVKGSIPIVHFEKSHIPWNKGKHHSEETKKKISEAKKANPTRYWLGKCRDKRMKKILSEVNLGRIPWNKNIKIDRNKYPKIGHLKKHTMEAKKKMAEASRGRIMSEESRIKNSEAHKGKKNYFYGKKHTKEALRKMAQARLKQSRSKEPTSIERKLYAELKARGLLFEKQRLINGHFVVDAYIPFLNLIIEADGDYWHSLPRVVKRDKSKNAYLTKCGFNLLRLTETEINDDSFKLKLDRSIN